MEFADILRSLLEDTDTTDTELAKAIGVNRKQIYRWVNNEAEAGIYKLKAICEHFNVSADYLLGLPKGLQWPR